MNFHPPTVPGAAGLAAAVTAASQGVNGRPPCAAGRAGRAAHAPSRRRRRAGRHDPGRWSPGRHDPGHWWPPATTQGRWSPGPPDAATGAPRPSLGAELAPVARPARPYCEGGISARHGAGGPEEEAPEHASPVRRWYRPDQQRLLGRGRLGRPRPVVAEPWEVSLGGPRMPRAHDRRRLQRSGGTGGAGAAAMGRRGPVGRLPAEPGATGPASFFERPPVHFHFHGGNIREAPRVIG